MIERESIEHISTDRLIAIAKECDWYYEVLSDGSASVEAMMLSSGDFEEIASEDTLREAFVAAIWTHLDEFSDYYGLAAKDINQSPTWQECLAVFAK